VIDPIDGTASFVCGLPVWGIAVGVLEKKLPVAGYFYMPATGDFFAATTEGRVYRNQIYDQEDK
jgi:myo-inositol-1(or 4)-monophosphatase